MSSIRIKHVERFMRAVKKAPATKNSILSTLSIIFDMAVIYEVVMANPIRSIKRYNRKKKERGVFTKEELKQLFPDDREMFERL